MPDTLWAGRALRELERLDSQARERIVAAVERFCATRHGRIEKMQGRDNQYRLRVGDWRVVFEPVGEDIRILSVGHRRDVYRR